ncbi:MAG: DMT family transporter [Alphaproteobacteria bacterium]
MNPLLAYISLGTAIILEVTGSSLLQKSQQFTKIFPTIGMGVCFVMAFYFLSIALKVIPLGLAYAIWAGLGIVLTLTVSTIVFRMSLDIAAIIGAILIVTGVIVISLFSNSMTH